MHTPLHRRQLRGASRRWLAFGPMLMPKGRRPAAIGRLNRMKFRHGSLRPAMGVAGLRVTRHGGPAAPGLFKHKTFTTQGSLMVKRKGRNILVGKRPRTMKQREASRRNLMKARSSKRRRTR
jgi:hypothetical protein